MRWNLGHYESENFSDPSLHHIFECEISGFLFCTKKYPNLGNEMQKNKLKKIVGYLLEIGFENWSWLEQMAYHRIDHRT